MNVAIVVEGPDDAAVYSVLIKRIDPTIERVHFRECGGHRKLRNKFVYFLDAFEKNPAAFNIRKVLVIRDSDCKDAGPLEKELQDIFAGSNIRAAFGVSFHATKCKLESWLLADEDAINYVSTRRGAHGGVQRIGENLEQFNEADQLYRRILSQAGLQDTDVVMREIAERARVERIAERCPHFRDFMRKVRE